MHGSDQGSLILQVGPEVAEKLLEQPHVGPMDFTGKVMSGWAVVEAAGLKKDADLKRYCECAVAFVKTLSAKIK